MMYINPHEAMSILRITTRQGLHKTVKQNNLTVKSQGAGMPNLYLKSEIEAIAKKPKPQKNKAHIKKVEKKEKHIATTKKRNTTLKKEVKKELNLEENFTVVTGKENIKKALKDFVEEKYKEPDTKLPTIKSDFTMKDLLNDIGQSEFDRVVELLKDNGTYKEQDRALILTYAVSFQNWVFATVASAKEDNTTTDQFGTLKLHPYFSVAEKCATQMSKNAAMLGIGVRNRIGLDIKEPKKETIFDMINQDDEF